MGPDKHNLPGVARDASSIGAIVAAFEAEGFSGQFAVRSGGTVECLTCHLESPADTVPVEHLRRLEGASDPDEMMAIVAITCPRCGAEGTLLLGYGPTASPDDAEVLAALDSPPQPGADPASA
jgi:hypothetical protein